MTDTTNRAARWDATMVTGRRDSFAELEHFVPTGYTSAARNRTNKMMFDRGEGGRLIDVDGNSYVDCVLGMGPIVVGHSEEVVSQRLHSQLDNLLVSASESPSTASFAPPSLRMGSLR